MRTTYRTLAWLIALAVAVQAAAIAFAFTGLGVWIQGGGVLDKAAMESESSTFFGDAGFGIHAVNGYMVIPGLALVLLVVSFFTKIPRGAVWAGAVLLLVVLQVTLGGLSFGAPTMGILHGLNALLLFTVALLAGQRARAERAVAGEPAPTAGAGVG